LDVVKVLEVVGGALVLSGRMTPLGLVLLTPVAVNILLFELLLAKQPGPGVVFVAVCVFLIWAYRSHFAPVFTTNARIGEPGGSPTAPPRAHACPPQPPC